MNLLKTIILISSIQMVAAFSLSQLKTKPSPSALKAWRDDPYGSYGGTRYYDSGYRYPSNYRYGYDNYDWGYQRYPNNRYNRGYYDRYNRGYNTGYERMDGSYQCPSLYPGFDDDLKYSPYNSGSGYFRGYNGRDYPNMDYRGYNGRSYLGRENRAYDRYPSYGYYNRGYDRYYNGRQNYLPSYSSYYR